MTGALQSGNWHRIAALKPRLRPHVQVHRHRYRGALWYVVEDRVGGKHYRFGPAAWRLIANLDGRRSLQQLWDELLAQPAEDTPTQDDIVHLLGQLNAADLIASDASVDVLELFERHQQQGRRRWFARLSNPLSLRFPLWDPDRFLAALQRALHGVPAWLSWAVWLLPVLLAALWLPPHWRELNQSFNDQLIAADNLLLLTLAFSAMKACHELAHGWALKRRGAEVHEMGLMLLLFYPVPYVDASGASAFVHKRERIVVGAAGMAMEIWLAALAFLAWTVVEPGLLRSLLYNMLVVGSVSTVVFNANPLLRYDGYYMLMDAIEVPNLGQRGNAWWINLLRRRGFGISEPEPECTAAERRWFIGYAPVALVYRLFITLTIAWFIGQQYFVVGVLLAAWSLGMGIVWPLLRGYVRLLSDPQAGSRGARVATLALGGPALLALLLFAVPLPHHTRVQGVVALPEQAVLRAGADGFIDAVLAAPGATLQPGTPVLSSNSIELRAQHRVQQASVDETQARLDAAWASQPALAGQLEEALKREQAALARLAEELTRLQLNTAIGGRLLLHQPDDLPGRFVRQGEPVAYLVGAVTPIVRAVVAQGQVDAVRADTRSISVRLPQAFGQALPAQLVRAVPQAAHKLPSAAMGQLGGGDISVDPRDDKGVTALETVFEFELRLPGQQAVQHLGSRAYVAFEHAPEPLGFRLVRAVRRQLLSQFEL